MDLKTGQEEEAAFKNSGWSQTIDDSILHWNKIVEHKLQKIIKLGQKKIMQQYLVLHMIMKNYMLLSTFRYLLKQMKLSMAYMK